jgi:hypothetical protein
MKKRFTLMMMVLCFLMSIPLKMMADDEVKVVSQYKVDKWSENTNFKFTTTDGKNYTCTLNDVPAGTQYIWFRLKIGTTEYGPQQDATKDLTLTSSYQKIYQISWEKPKALMIDNTSGKTSYTITYDRVNNNIKCEASESGSTGGSTDPTEKWDTEKTNRLTEKPRVYSQGFYLAGNFFTFDKKDEINYDDAVFKFQQQTDQDISTAKGARTVYEVYKVEIPASLTAHAQVMYVDEFGNKKYIFGPGSAYGVSYTNPKTDTSIGWFDATPVSVYDPITLENANYWKFANRNVSSTEYSDGMYNLFIAVNSKTHTVAKWKIEHDSDRRVAYFISDAPDATALPVYDAFDKSHNSDIFSNKFYASVNFSAGRNYYVISNYLRSKDYISWTEHDYETKMADKDYVPTTNKLFLLGNGGSAYDTSDPSNATNEFSPNEKPMPGGDLGNIIVEYNPNNGNNDLANTKDHLGFRGQILQQNGHTKITSVSMVGDAIPGTLKEDGSWDFTSKAADMIYDDVEQCYTTTIVTTAGDGEKHFRFVGNHNPKINWFEDTDGTEADKMAKTPYNSTDPKVYGHTADANDPNKVNYTEEGAYSDKDWNIRWNRPAGRWNVRLYFYTRNVEGVLKTDYYYTITANYDLVLRDFDDVQYKNEGKRKILLRGGYKFFRTWSDDKAWKVSDDVDIFIVNGMEEKNNSVEFSLEKISDSKTANVIPANVGVILATKMDATHIQGGGKFYARPSLTSYNTLVIPMEEYTGEETTAVDYSKNLLVKMVDAGVVPTYNAEKKEYNYLFGFFRANKGLGVTTFDNNQFLLGFWLSKGAGLFYSNSAYLPVSEATAKKMNLGVSYNDFDPTTGVKKAPVLLYDFANVGGTTGINEVVNQSTKLNDGKYYTLSGQEVEYPTAGGIYIHNGRKFVVK